MTKGVVWRRRKSPFSLWVDMKICQLFKRLLPTVHSLPFWNNTDLFFKVRSCNVTLNLLYIRPWGPTDIVLHRKQLGCLKIYLNLCVLQSWENDDKCWNCGLKPWNRQFVRVADPNPPAILVGSGVFLKGSGFEKFHKIFIEYFSHFSKLYIKINVFSNISTF